MSFGHIVRDAQTLSPRTVLAKNGTPLQSSLGAANVQNLRSAAVIARYPLYTGRFSCVRRFAAGGFFRLIEDSATYVSVVGECDRTLAILAIHILSRSHTATGKIDVYCPRVREMTKMCAV